MEKPTATSVLFILPKPLGLLVPLTPPWPLSNSRICSVFLSYHACPDLRVCSLSSSLWRTLSRFRTFIAPPIASAAELHFHPQIIALGLTERNYLCLTVCFPLRISQQCLEPWAEGRTNKTANSKLSNLPSNYCSPQLPRYSPQFLCWGFGAL